MAKRKNKKTSFWAIAATALVTAAAAIGAVKLFGVPSALKPEGEIHLKVVSEITPDEIIDDAVFYSTTKNMGLKFLEEHYKYTFKNKSVLYLNVSNSYEDTIEVEDYAFASEHKLGLTAAASSTSLVYVGDSLTYLRINYINDEKEETNVLLVPTCSLITPGNNYQNYVNVSSKNMYLNSFNFSFLEEFKEDYKEILNFEFLANLDSEENATRDDVENEVKSVAKVDFRNSKKGTAVEADEFIDMMNEDEDIVTGVVETTEDDVTTQYYENVTLNQGGLMIGDLDVTDGETGKISWVFDDTFEYDFIKMTVKGLELEAAKDGYETTSSRLNGSTTIWCDSNALDTSKTSDVNEVYFTNTETSLSFIGVQCPVILEIEFFSIEEIK